MKVLITTISLFLFFSNSDFEASLIKDKGVEQPTMLPLENDQNNDFNGLWVNQGDQKKMITKCKILYKDNSYIVQMWGACMPEDCEWGENVATDVEKGADRFELLWDREFAESNITYELIDGKLKMTHKRSFKDNSGRPGYELTEYFTQ